MKIAKNYSPNFDLKKRKQKQIKFLIFHYTGMKSEIDAINRLTNQKSKVSCHYFIKKKWSNIKFSSQLIYCLACWNFKLEDFQIFEQILYWS